MGASIDGGTGIVSPGTLKIQSTAGGTFTLSANSANNVALSLPDSDGTFITSSSYDFTDFLTDTTHGSRLVAGYVTFNSSATISQSYNVSSVTKGTTGAFAITWSTAMADADYGVIVTTGKTAGSYTDTSGWLLYAGCVTRSTTVAYISQWKPSSTWLEDTNALTTVIAFTTT